MSKIEWTDKTWNPIAGCSIVSPGCTHCYAMKTAARLEAIDAAKRAAGRKGMPHYAGLTQPSKAGPVWTGKIARASDETLTEPLRRKKPTMYFVNSMSDLFHEDVPDEWIDQVFAVMALCPQHTFQVLTKRSARMRDYLARDDAAQGWMETDIWRDADARCDADDDESKPQSYHERTAQLDHVMARMLSDESYLPLPNVWLGVSAERQQEADARIPDLLATPAAVRFVSAEPLLGPIDFTRRQSHPAGDRLSSRTWLDDIDWIIVGGESGTNARPMHPDWARSIRDQCADAGVAFFFKQWGEFSALGSWKDGERHLIAYRGALTNKHVVSNEHAFLRVGKAHAGRLLDGREHNEMPVIATKTSEAA